MKKSIALLLSVAAVSACGGSDSSGEQSVSVDATPIRLFSDASGVARLVAVSNGEVTTGYVITPELTAVLAEIESTSEVTPFDIESLSIVDTGPNTNIRSGAISVEGSVLNVLAATTTDEDAALVLFEEPSSGLTFLVTEGYQATNIPSGTASYSGVLGLQNILFDAEPELGTFTATAGFDASPSITLTGSTTSYTVNGTASISGSSFSSNSMTINDGSGPTGASMNGDFHGSGANSVAGVIYSNDASGEFRGGFVGSQD
ncbi:hypothetical protein [Yoonia sediminilitoris]|uniref:Transferrin-binding protein B C-lobe/N-lobe beta barrel domain-containing protein n=1 Tax=Yoonia sediminilitoris TaxID=1286148 RepID=A0A2T6KRT6_9RHOB|nr:hypothetical protein [Yoonia sediminilitoris]PUB19273.1 hypothetical protein C8N45_101868 [Yoonia sediminilitoris]RCW99441.1 hypothetical protein DFP92_101868 [Yoonia sediminilitoris]